MAGAAAATLAALIVVLMIHHRDSGDTLLGVEHGGNSSLSCGSSCTPTANGWDSAALTAGPGQTGGAEDADRRNPDFEASLQNHSCSGRGHSSVADRATQVDGGRSADASIAKAESVGYVSVIHSPDSASHPAGPAAVDLVDVVAGPVDAVAAGLDDAAAADPVDAAAAGPVNVAAAGPVDAAVAGPVDAAAVDAADADAGAGTTAAAESDAATDDVAPAAVADAGTGVGGASSSVAIAGRGVPRGSLAAVAEVPGGRARARLLARLVRLMPLGEAWSAAMARRSA
jgi:hypothetical protein